MFLIVNCIAVNVGTNLSFRLSGTSAQVPRILLFREQVLSENDMASKESKVVRGIECDTLPRPTGSVKRDATWLHLMDT